MASLQQDLIAPLGTGKLVDTKWSPLLGPLLARLILVILIRVYVGMVFQFLCCRGDKLRLREVTELTLDSPMSNSSLRILFICPPRFYLE